MGTRAAAQLTHTFPCFDYAFNPDETGLAAVWAFASSAHGCAEERQRSGQTSSGNHHPGVRLLTYRRV